MKKEIFRIAGYFNEKLRNSLDFEFWWRVALAGFNFAYTNEVVLTRIKPLGSLSSDSIITYQNHILALDYCLHGCVINNRNDLIPYINRSYQRSWQIMIRLYANQENRRKAFDAFTKSCKYGMSWGSLHLITEAFLGYKITNRITQLKKCMKSSD